MVYLCNILEYNICKKFNKGGKHEKDFNATVIAIPIKKQGEFDAELI